MPVIVTEVPPPVGPDVVPRLDTVGAVVAAVFGQQGVIERSEKYQQRAAAQIQLQAGKDFAEVRTHALGAQIVDGLAAQPEVVHAVPRAHESVGAVAEGDQAEAVSLTLGDQPPAAK